MRYVAQCLQDEKQWIRYLFGTETSARTLSFELGTLFTTLLTYVAQQKAYAHIFTFLCRRKVKTLLNITEEKISYQSHGEQITKINSVLGLHNQTR